MSKYTPVGQKYQINDRVKKRYFSSYRYGTVLDFYVKENGRGRPYYYYKIKWDNSSRPEPQSQNTLKPAEENT
tara:strand:+ start:136 stop:354 length:219 start_codon:yes stop_codon:yes gene_type:complete